MTRLYTQNGVSLIAAVFIIVILAFMGVMFVSLINTSSLTSVNDLQSTQALYVAEGGLEDATLLLNTSTLSNRITCGSVTGYPDLTNNALGGGQFTVKTDVGSPFDPGIVTLAGAGIAGTTINVNADPTTAGYAPFGRIMIDRELIDYSGISGNSFIGAVRGRDNTPITTHANGAAVGQYQCSITSAGGIPTVAAPTAKRTVKEGIQLQEGWIVGTPGAVNAQQPFFLKFQQTAWSIYDSSALNINVQLNGISMLSYADGMAVGAPGGAAAQRPFVLRYINGAWVSQNTGLNINRALNSIYCIASNECWAVGAPGAFGSNQRPWIVRYNGVWSNIATANINAPLNSVYCPASGNCWAVGNQSGGELIYRLQAGAWGRFGPTGLPNVNLLSVFCTGVADCWTVGAGGNIFRWTGGSNWINVGSPVAQQLQSVHMLDTNGDGVAEDGWAVGATTGGRPTVLRWNIPCLGGAGTNAWNNCTATGIVPAINLQLNKVTCVDVNDCWAVGNGGLILHWDGSTWSRVQAGLTAETLLNVQVIGPEQRPQAAWQEAVQ